MPRPLEPKDFEKIRSFGQADFAAVIKDVKSHLKGPLADKQPIYALNFKRIGQVGEALVVEDAKGERLVLTDAGMSEEPASCHLLPLLPPDLFAGPDADRPLPARSRHAQAADQAAEHRDEKCDCPADALAVECGVASPQWDHEHSRPDAGLRRSPPAGDRRQRGRRRATFG